LSALLDHTLLPGATRITQLARDLCESSTEADARQLLVREAVALCGCAVAGYGRLLPSGKLEFSWAGPAATITGLTAALALVEEAAAAAALAANGVVLSADLAEEQRWPDYARAMVLHTPIRSLRAQPVELAGTELGVLVLYSDQTDYFTAERCDLGTVLAQVAALGLSLLESRHKSEHLSIALQNSREIGQAIGIVMASHKVTSEKAFELLRTASQHGHVKLREVAREVTLTGQLPAAPEGARPIGQLFRPGSPAVARPPRVP
jgi:hypothetical protein